VPQPEPVPRPGPEQRLEPGTLQVQERERPPQEALLAGLAVARRPVPPLAEASLAVRLEPPLERALPTWQEPVRRQALGPGQARRRALQRARAAAWVRRAAVARVERAPRKSNP